MADQPTAGTPRQPVPLLIEKEMKESYLTYALSVIHSRALPDVRDGLKPSQRRILYAMHELNLGPRSRHIKCAKICGDTSGNFHPHGESVIYPTLVRLGQDFNMRYVLIDKQGNFGTNRPDNPAAMRYTEARLSHAAIWMLEDIAEDTVDFVANYDGRTTEPAVLPARFPNLICNGSSGIAVGMATSLPPHNLGEVAAALAALIKNPEVSHDELLRHVPGPDFPTGGIIMGREGIGQAYRYGRGLITLRAKHTIEEKGGRKLIVFTELPYQVTILSIVEAIVEAAKSGKIDSISDVNDETNARIGLRLVVELKKSADETVTLNQLFQFTPLQSTFSIINLALVGGQPKTLSFKQLLESYRDHRVEVLQRRTRHRLREAQKRLHLIEGLRIALANIDEVVAVIKASRTPEAARETLEQRFQLTELQAKHVLDMRLARLTSLEIDKLEEEYKALVEEIRGFEAMLADVRLIHKLILEQMQEMVGKVADQRRTQISDEQIGGRFDIEDLIEEELMAVTVSHKGYVKRTSLEEYRSQGRGGKGIVAGEIGDEDFLEKLFIASTHDYLLFFTNQGRVYWRKVHQIPEMARSARGRALANIIGMEESERVQETLRVDNFDDRYLLVATEQGVVKKTVLAAYSRPRENGIRAVELDEGDNLIGASLLRDHQSVVLATASGLAIRFDEHEVRPMGRVARGVRGIKLRQGDQVVSLVVADETDSILTVCKNGYGKRTLLGEYRLQGRGGQGIINIKTTERNGPVVTVLAVRPDDETMMTTKKGMVVRTPVAGISEIGRATQGVRVITLEADDAVVSCARVPTEDGNGEPSRPRPTPAPREPMPTTETPDTEDDDVPPVEDPESDRDEEN